LHLVMNIQTMNYSDSGCVRVQLVQHNAESYIDLVKVSHKTINEVKVKESKEVQLRIQIRGA
jgi:predicted transcriptional regulator